MLVAPAIELEHIIPLKHIGGESAISDGPQVVFGAIHTLCAVVQCLRTVDGTLPSPEGCGPSATIVIQRHRTDKWQGVISMDHSY